MGLANHFHGVCVYRWVVDGLATATVTGAVAFTSLTFFTQEMSPEAKYLVPLSVQALLGVPALLLVFGLTADGGETVTRHVLQHPATQWLGDISYSLYLTHWLVRRVALGAFNAPESSGYPPWMILPLLAVALPLAWLVNVVVELPSRRWLCCLTESAGTASLRGSAWGSYGSTLCSAGDAAAQTEQKPHEDDEQSC